VLKLQISGLLFSVVAAGAAVDPAAQMKRTCTRCHNLDVVRAQRLSREEWATELEKMASMGARIKDRAALLDYLTRKYGRDGKAR
jgi:hypothetical protein